MRLVASVILDEEVERGRYLDVFLDHLHDFCDEIVVARDGEDGIDFFAHEGRARQQLLELTFAAEPTHVIAVDADEFVADGPGLRTLIAGSPAASVWPLEMLEVWELDDDGLCVRVDGGWRPHVVPACWRVPDRLDASWRIRDRALACGRVPQPVDTGGQRRPVTEILHFGWANPAERQTRYDRYATHDGGRFHASRHLESILWPCDRMQLRPYEWPDALAAHRPEISRRAGAVTA